MATSFSLVYSGSSSSNENSNLSFEQLRIGHREPEDSKWRNEYGENGQWVHRYRALFAAATCPAIQSICFLPMAPHQPQLLYAKRGNDLADTKGFVSFLDIEGHQEKITKVFPLSSAISISESTCELNSAVRRIVRKILSHISEDPETLGVALHFSNEPILVNSLDELSDNFRSKSNDGKGVMFFNMAPFPSFDFELKSAKRS